MKNIQQFQNVFKNKQCYIIGKGPTNFDFSSIKNISEPIFFINESALLASEYRPDKKNISFMFAHDTSTKKSCKDNKDYFCILPNWKDNGEDGRKYHENFLDEENKIISEYAILIEKNKAPTPWLRICHKETCNMIPTENDRQNMSDHNWLPILVGTIRTAIGFAFYTGIQEIFLVGCDGLDKNETKKKFGSLYDNRLHKHISSTPYGSHYKHRLKAEIMMKNCNIKYTFIETPEL